MRLETPRVAPLPDEELPSELDELWERSRKTRWGLLNIYRCLAHSPEALRRFNEWSSYLVSRRNPLPPREREIVILRAGILCKSGYEWAQHVGMGLAAGLTPEEIERVKHGAEAGWSEADAVLIRATDELLADHFVSKPTWEALGRCYTDEQRMHVVFCAAQYAQVSMILNTFGVPLEEGQSLDPDLKG
jgi:4-carboxymuconolactone decarboxylase